MPAIKRVQYFSAPLPDDFSLLSRNLGKKFSATYVQLNYGSLEDTFSLGIEKISGKNILVGNSSTLTNNHVEVFKLLTAYELDGKQIIVPLSYGDLDYRKFVLDAGNNLFGDKFLPVLSFLPLSVYNNLIASCSVVIMNQYRQQGLGNICTALYSGAKLFLNQENGTIDFLKKQGACVYEVDDLKRKDNGALLELTLEQKRMNKLALKKIWGRERVLQNAKDFINLIRV